MYDLVVIALVLAAFAGAATYVHVCTDLTHLSPRPERQPDR